MPISGNPLHPGLAVKCCAAHPNPRRVDGEWYGNVKEIMFFSKNSLSMRGAEGGGGFSG